MEKTSPPTFPSALQALAAMAVLLERFERNTRQASAEQYRDVVRQVAELLQAVEPGDALHALLKVAPATAEIYENLRYAHAGLVLAPLERATAAEQAAALAIERARHGAPAR
jgi:hypothetical protein